MPSYRKKYLPDKSIKRAQQIHIEASDLSITQSTFIRIKVFFKSWYWFVSLIHASAIRLYINSLQQNHLLFKTYYKDKRIICMLDKSNSIYLYLGRKIN